MSGNEASAVGAGFAARALDAACDRCVAFARLGSSVEIGKLQLVLLQQLLRSSDVTRRERALDLEQQQALRRNCHAQGSTIA